MAFDNRGTAILPGHREHRTIGERLLPFLPPWALSAAVWPVSALAHANWGSDPAALPWAAAGLTLAGAGLTALTARVSAGRPAMRAHSTATVAAASAWTTAATIVGPATHPLIDMWLIGGAAVALSWNIRALFKSKDKAGASGDGELLKAVKLAGTKVRGAIDVAPNKVTAELQLPPGQLTAKDAAGARDRLASALSVAPNAVRVVPNPDHADRATLTVVPENMLKTPMPWPGPSAPGDSIAAPLVLGVYEDGQPLVLWLPGDKRAAAGPRQASHVIVIGMNGSGKSHGAKLAWTEILTRTDVELWVADPAKGKQTVGEFAQYMDRTALTEDDTRALLDGLASEIERRATWLGEHGYDQWEPGCGLPYIVVWVEEAAKVGDSDALLDAVQTARSAGMSIVISLQRPSFRNLTVDTRQQFGAVWCFGVKSLEDAAFALSDELIDAGCRPEAWKNTKAGMNYLEAAGIDEDRLIQPARTFATTDEEMLAAIAAVRSPATSSPASATADGSVHTTRGAAMTTPARRPADPFSGRLTDEQDRQPPPMPENPEPGTDLDVDPDSPLPALDPLANIALPASKPTLAEARQLLCDVLTELRNRGLDEVGPKDIPKSFTEGDRRVRARSWVSAEMARLADLGVLIETNVEGVYRFPPTRDSDAA